MCLCRWLYRLYLAVDGNFKLKNLERNITDDEPLGDGSAYFVNQRDWASFIVDHKGDEKEVQCIVSRRDMALVLRLCYR